MLNVEGLPVYLPDARYEALLDALEATATDVDPRSAITWALAEIGLICPAIVLTDPART
jgi:hypothetical protein